MQSKLIAKLLFGLVMLFPFWGNSKNWEDPTENSYLLTGGIVIPSLGYTLEIPKSSATKLTYNPPGRSRTHLGVAYQWFALSTSSANSAKPEDDYLKGAGQSSDIQLRFYLKSFAAEIFYQKYQGYYLENSEAADPNLSSSSPRFQFPNFSSEHTGASVTYIVDPDSFSLGAAYDLGARQTISGGSWLLNSSISRHNLTTPTSLIPSQLSGQYGAIEFMRDAHLTTLTVGGGGGYTYVLNDFYASAALIVTIGQQQSAIQYVGSEVTGLYSTSAYHLKGALGYNSPKFVTALILNIDGTNIPIDTANFSSNTYSAALIFGLRVY